MESLFSLRPSSWAQSLNEEITRENWRSEKTYHLSDKNQLDWTEAMNTDNCRTTRLVLCVHCQISQTLVTTWSQLLSVFCILLFSKALNELWRRPLPSEPKFHKFKNFVPSFKGLSQLYTLIICRNRPSKYCKVREELNWTAGRVQYLDIETFMEDYEKRILKLSYQNSRSDIHNPSEYSEKLTTSRVVLTYINMYQLKRMVRRRGGGWFLNERVARGYCLPHNRYQTCCWWHLVVMVGGVSESRTGIRITNSEGSDLWEGWKLMTESDLWLFSEFPKEAVSNCHRWT